MISIGRTTLETPFGHQHGVPTTSVHTKTMRNPHCSASKYTREMGQTRAIETSWCAPISTYVSVCVCPMCNCCCRKNVCIISGLLYKDIQYSCMVAQIPILNALVFMHINIHKCAIFSKPCEPHMCGEVCYCA